MQRIPLVHSVRISSNLRRSLMLYRTDISRLILLYRGTASEASRSNRLAKRPAQRRWRYVANQVGGRRRRENVEVRHTLNHTPLRPVRRRRTPSIY